MSKNGSACKIRPRHDASNALNRLRFSATIVCLASRGTPLNTDASGTAPPDALGPFRVRHQIGAGALGPVLLADDPHGDRQVAVKVFHLDLAPERVHELMGEFERLTAIDLHHPSIVAPIASGIVGTLAYLAQDFVLGESLDVTMRDRPATPPTEALRTVMQVASALDAAAARGVHHGALHPRDILIAASPDDEPLARLTGLGVARALGAVAAAIPVRRPYVSPERVAAVHWDQRADVFSLAALAHQMLWGRRLTAIGALAARELTEVNGGRLVALRRVFARALAPGPNDRFETAGAFSAMLVEAFDASLVPRVGTSARRRAARTETTAGPAATPGAATAPRLPLDRPPIADTAPPLSRPEPARPVAVSAPRPATRVVLERAGAARPMAPVHLVAAAVARPADTSTPPIGRRSRGADRVAPILMPPQRPLPALTAAPHARSLWGPLALTAVLCLLLGFAGGYWLATRQAAGDAPLVPALQRTPADGTDPDRGN